MQIGFTSFLSSNQAFLMLLHQLSHFFFFFDFLNW
jgi:hypothetical protein